MNRRLWLRAIGLTAAVVGTGGWLHAASAQPVPPPGYRPPGTDRAPADRLIPIVHASRHRPRGAIAGRRRRGRTAMSGPTATGAGSAATIYGCPDAGSRGARGIGGCPATGVARDKCGFTSTAHGDRRTVRHARAGPMARGERSCWPVAPFVGAFKKTPEPPRILRSATEGDLVWLPAHVTNWSG